MCAFIHYSVADTVPYYVQIYIRELSRHFDKVNVLTNNSKLEQYKNLFAKNTGFHFFENRGYDFGMFYRFINEQNTDLFSQIAIVNDSNILLKKLDPVFEWANNEDFDFWGIIDSIEKPWFSTHLHSYHIQSHFLVLNQGAIPHLKQYFKQVDLKSIFEETDVKLLRRKVIDQWEIGFSQYLLKAGLRAGSYIQSANFLTKYKPKKINVTHSLYHEIIENGYPLLKRKVIQDNPKFSFLNNRKIWENTISRFFEKEWNVLALENSMPSVKRRLFKRKN